MYNHPLRVVDPDGMKGDDWVKRDNNYVWDDRVVDQKTATEFQGDGAKYIGKEVQVAVKDKDGNLSEHIGLHADGSISKGDWTIEAGATGNFSNSNGSIFRSRQTEGGFVGGSYGFALIGGVGVAGGMVTDATGNSSPYFTFSGNLGIGEGGQGEAGLIKPDGPHQFLLDDFEGKGGSYNVGVSVPFISVGATTGGSLKSNIGGTQALYPSNFGKNVRGYTIKQIGASPGGAGASAMYSFSTTWLLK